MRSGRAPGAGPQKCTPKKPARLPSSTQERQLGGGRPRALPATTHVVDHGRLSSRCRLCIGNSGGDTRGQVMDSGAGTGKLVPNIRKGGLCQPPHSSVGSRCRIFQASVESSGTCTSVNFGHLISWVLHWIARRRPAKLLSTRPSATPQTRTPVERHLKTIGERETTLMQSQGGSKNSRNGLKIGVPGCKSVQIGQGPDRGFSQAPPGPGWAG